MYADIIVDLQYGDCGKGKVANALCRDGDYTHIVRYNGGCNAGHTIFNEGKKFVTHHIPCGVFHGIRSVIGPGCVVSPKLFMEELEEFNKRGFNSAEDLVKIAYNAHIITDFHLAQDSKDEDIGTTKRGNGPAYRDKYYRKGMRAEDIPELEPYLIDFHDEIHVSSQDTRILFEGAQGFGLDVDWGDYPYVTSSHCTVGGAVLNGVPPKAIRNVWGVAKCYETYVGAKKHEGSDPIFEIIREAGEEYGATTGRPRQINWMDWNLVERAININGVDKLVFNKMDILDEVQDWSLFLDETLHEFENSRDFEHWIKESATSLGVNEVFFSRNKEFI